MKIERDLKNLTVAILLIYGLFAGFYLLEQQAENADDQRQCVTEYMIVWLSSC